MSDDQRAAIAFLADPATHGGARVERIDTHGAVVVLTPTQAFKLKRAVRFSYMDFSTVERRRAACLAELAINRRTAPTLYQEVRSIARRDGRLAFADAAAADAVDFVVVMRRFDDRTQFDRLAGTGELDAALVRRLAAVVAAFHDREPAIRADFGGAEGIRRVIDENRHEMAARADILPAREAAALDAGCRAAWTRIAALLDRRREAGEVRRCHGDLHLANICLVDGEPTLFDAIEFNDDIAIIDTLFDIAFLVVDLESRVGAEAANAALNAYLELRPATGDLAILSLLLSLRAAIRAHTRAAVAAIGRDPAAAVDARRYLERAAGYLQPAAPRLVGIGGVSGSGKTTLARALAPRLASSPGAVILRSDVLRKRQAGVPPTHRLGPEHYTVEASRRVYDALLADATALLAAGQVVVVDAVFQRESERAQLAAVGTRAGVRFDGIWLEPDAGTAAARIAARRDDASDADHAVLEAQLGRPIGGLDAWHRIDARGEPSQVAKRAWRAIS